MMEMGFPQNWCEKALVVTDNNFESALTWVLSNGEMLQAEDLAEEQAAISAVLAATQTQTSPDATQNKSDAITPEEAAAKAAEEEKLKKAKEEKEACERELQRLMEEQRKKNFVFLFKPSTRTASKIRSVPKAFTLAVYSGVSKETAT